MEKFGISHILADNLMSTPFCEGEPEIEETCLHSYHEDEVPINYTNILATAISSSHQLKITGIEFSVDRVRSKRQRYTWSATSCKQSLIVYH